MKFKVILMIVICTDNFLESIGSTPEKINQKGEYQPYYGYTIVSMIDVTLSKAAKQIETFIRTSSLKKKYSALSPSTYHMSIYTIYSIGNDLIPPVQRWVNETGKKIPNRGWLPDGVLEEQNNRAMCIIEKYLNKPLFIKYASLKFDDNIIRLTLEMEEDSLRRIQNTRKELVKVYEHPNLSMEPINKKLHITLAYVYGKAEGPDKCESNKLNELIKPFNGAKLSLPSVYLFESMTKYYPYKKKAYVDCRAYFQ